MLSSCGHGNGSANAWPPMPAMNSDYASFVAFLAARYGSGLAAIEIWNEPDQANEQYFAGPNKPALYAALLRAAYPAIKAAEPERHRARRLDRRLERGLPARLYAAGIKGYYDALAVHFYTLTLGASARSARSSSPTGTASRCGSTSSAGRAAGRRKPASRNSPASRRRSRRATWRTRSAR